MEVVGNLFAEGVFALEAGYSDTGNDVSTKASEGNNKEKEPPGSVEGRIDLEDEVERCTPFTARCKGL